MIEPATQPYEGPAFRVTIAQHAKLGLAIGEFLHAGYEVHCAARATEFPDGEIVLALGEVRRPGGDEALALLYVGESVPGHQIGLAPAASEEAEAAIATFKQMSAEKNTLTAALDRIWGPR